MSLIQIQNLKKSYPTPAGMKTILHDLNMEVASGELIAIVGKSGSGKTTLLNVLGAIDLPDSGSIQINDTALEHMDEAERTLFRRHNLGFVFQFFNLVSTLTVEENLLLPLQLCGLPARTDTVHDYLERIQLADKAHMFPEKLSGGEQQRIAVCRALIHRPALILADEPTGNLDEETSLLVMSVLEQQVRQSGATLVMVTHSLELAQRMDRVFEMKSGHLDVWRKE